MTKQESLSIVARDEPLLPADPMVSMIERLVMDPSADMDKLERMLAMKERMENKSSEQAFAAAFAKMQAALPAIPERGAIKNRSGEVQSTYPLWADMTMSAAVTEYLRREAEANRKKRGADHMRIMDEVAREYGVDIDVLSDAVIRASFSGVN